MAGLLSQAQQQPPQAGAQQPQAQPPPQQEPSQGQPGQAPQEAPQEQQPADSQEAYDVATGQMLDYVYDQSGMGDLTKAIEASGNPQQGMARLLGRLLTTTVQSAMMAGKRIAPDLIFQGAIEVVRALSEVAQTQGLLDAAQEKEVTEAAFYDGLTLFANEAKDESLSEEERQRYVKLLDMIEQLEQQGAMEQPADQPNESEVQA